MDPGATLVDHMVESVAGLSVPDVRLAFATIRRALELGVNHFEVSPGQPRTPRASRRFPGRDMAHLGDRWHTWHTWHTTTPHRSHTFNSTVNLSYLTGSQKK